MKRTIKISLDDESDLYERYNKEVVSRDLINYLIERASFFNKNDKLEIVIKNTLKNTDDLVNLIRASLKSEYENLNYKYNRNNLVQMVYLILGIVVLFLSTLVAETVLREIILIVGWIFIWSMMELEIFSDKDIKKRRRIILKILKSKIIEI